MNAAASFVPKTIPEYLAQLRSALTGSDPAVVQDALYDAEEYLRSELAENPGLDEATVLASIAGSYGDPAEVADIYRQTESTVRKAMAPPPPRQHGSALGRFFGVLADPRAYTSLFYMLLSLATGTFYFTWAVAGLSLSLGFAILIIGVPFVILFFASVRGLALVEGRLVEAMLGERMPRRPPYADRDQPVLERIKQMFTDPRTWSTLLYQMLMLPLGTLYFNIALLAIVFSLAFAALPVLQAFRDGPMFYVDGLSYFVPLWTLPFTALLGLLMIVLSLHACRGIGRLHAQLAKHLLVKSAA